MAHYGINDEPGLVYEPRIVSAPKRDHRQYRSITLIGIAIVLVLSVMFLQFKKTSPGTHASPANQTISQDAPDNTRMPKRL